MPRWLFYSLLTVLLFGVWGAVSKAIGDRLSASKTQALSTLGVLPVMAALAFSRELRRGERRLRGSVWAFLAGLLVGGSNVAYYKAMSLADASTVIALTALYPLVTVVLALLFLREKLSRIQLGGVATALAAIYFLNVGQGALVLSGWLAYALIPLVLWGAGALLQKVSALHVSNELSTMAFLAAFVPLAAFILLLEPSGPSLEGREWVMVVSLGALFALGNLTLIAAYGNRGKASVVTPLAGLYPVVTILLAILWLGEKVTEWQKVAGIFLAMASVVALSQEPRGKTCELT